MDLTSIIGIVVGFGCILTSIFLGGELSTFFNLDSIFIVVGGTLSGTIVSFSKDTLLSVPNVFKKIYQKNEIDLQADIDLIIEVAGVARKEGILALENATEEMDNEFLKKGIMLVVDGVDAELVKDILEAEIYFMRDRHEKGQSVFKMMGTLAPAFGLVGTLIGLINMLKNLSDPDALGPAMSVSLLTTFYGAVLANLLFTPIATRLEGLTNDESMEMELLLEGILSIQEGESTMVIQDKLASFLPNKGEAETEQKEDDYE